jgi:Family of unknown function (DUF6282)
VKEKIMTEYHPLLKNAFELHCHPSPSIFPRRQNDWEFAEDLVAAGMSGALIKSHEAPTADRATLIRDKYPDLNIYGGLACNYFTGGLSPSAVDAAIRSGAKIVWMPTFSSKQHQDHFAKQKSRLFSNEKPLVHPAEGIEILDENKRLKNEVRDILDLIASADIILATGHLSPEEVEVLVDAAFEQKVQKVLIQHPDMNIAKISLEQQQVYVNKGAILEKCYLACSPDFNDLTVAEMAANICTFGAENCILVTDYGQPHNIPPVAGLSEFVGSLCDAGIRGQEIEQMIVTNPRMLLNL